MVWVGRQQGQEVEGKMFRPQVLVMWAAIPAPTTYTNSVHLSRTPSLWASISQARGDTTPTSQGQWQALGRVFTKGLAHGSYYLLPPPPGSLLGFPQLFHITHSKALATVA